MNVIVAGAGHGGITAAANLAKSGYRVTVIEKKQRTELGYDWQDCMNKRVFEQVNFPYPGDECFNQTHRQCFYNPKKSVKLVPDKQPHPAIGYIERKFLINYIIDYAEKCGVKFIFGEAVVGAICDDESVFGVKTEKGEYRCDLVIDAAGIYSPVRRSLPEEFNVRLEHCPDEVLCAWRGYFEKTSDFTAGPKGAVYFDHCGKAGLDWVIDEGDYFDVLVGGLGSLTQSDIDRAIADFKKDYPLGKIIRGGYADMIPLGRTFPVLVCNGYAAVGNSAGMTEPLSGSGIDLSMSAGKLLADTLIESGGDATVSGLWGYNYRYFKQYAERYYNEITIKSTLLKLKAQDIDFLFEKKIMTAKEITGRSSSKYTASELLGKAAILSKPKLAPTLLQAVGKLKTAKKLKHEIPESYNQSAVERWIESYRDFK